MAMGVLRAVPFSTPPCRTSLFLHCLGYNTTITNHIYKTPHNAYEQPKRTIKIEDPRKWLRVLHALLSENPDFQMPAKKRIVVIGCVVIAL